MDDQHDSPWADAMLRRPAVDPGIPGPERALLTAPGTLLTPACHARPARNRDYLPTDPDRRGATVDGAVMGMTAAAFVAIGGATPLAIGTLIFQDPVGWQSASGRYGLLLAEILAIITAVVFVTRIVRFGRPGGKAPADVAARTYHGRYLTAADVREADAAYRDWRQAAALAEVGRQHLDMLARTAADEHGIAEIDVMSRQARAVRQAFREPPG